MLHRKTLAGACAPGCTSRNTPLPAGRRAGFTLVELLVVIGIITVLIGILMPVLTRARDASVRVKCLSNLRQLGSAFQIYATAFNNRIPLGYWSGQKQTNYLIHINENGASFYTMIGILYHQRLLESPEALYCPAETLEPWQFNTPSNPWPPPETPVATRLNTRAGYGTRPTVNWLETGAWPEQMSDITKLKNHAILADLAPTPYFVNRRHRKGMNVYYADGSAHWVDRKVFEKALVGIPDIIYPFSPAYNARMLDPDATPPSGLWKALDGG